MKKRLLMPVLARTILLFIFFSFFHFVFAGEKNTGFFPVAVTVKGVIKDQEGKPLAGANISEKNANNNVTTDANGQFAITVRDGATLVISFIGFETQEVAVVAGKDLDIALVRTTVLTSEVVVTALGIRKERQKISYATQEVKGSALEKAPEPNVVSNMVGKVAGLNIATKSNLFENPEILLRGAATLVVIDGVPTDKDNFDFWNLNPNDIESVNVLKGTAAAALYGTLGINGAIMITTKKGKAGARGVEVTYNTTTQFQMGFLRVPKTQKQYGMGWSGYYAFINGKGGGGWYDDYGYVWGPKLDVANSTNASGFEEYPQYNSPYDPNTFFPFSQRGYNDQSHYKPLPAISRGKDNLKNFLDNELLTTHNVSVAGKNENADYRISVTHLYQKGQVPNTKVNATTISLAGGIKVNEKLRLESTLSYNKQYTPNYPQTFYGANNFFYNILLWMGPDVDIRDLRNYWQPGGGRDAGGSLYQYGVKDEQQFNYNYTWYNNPWYLAYEALNGYTNDVITGQLNATYDFTKDLSFFVRSGIITNNALSTVKTPKSYIYYGNAEFDGNYSERRTSSFQIVTDALLTYKKTIAQDFNFTASLGGSSRFTTAGYSYSKTNGLSVPASYNFANSTNAVTTVNQRREKMVNSVFGYVDADYKRMIYLGITARNDVTTSLQKPNNSYVYPSASLGLVLSNMVKMPDFISYAKLRGSWSKISSDNINLYGDPYRDWYATLPVYTTGPRWNGTNTSLVSPGTLIQAAIKPNSTISQEYGAEARFLKNRIGLDFTYFTYLDKDFAIPAPVSSASGYNSLFVNGDEIQRKGVELVVTATPIATGNLKWDITANYSTVHSWAKEWYNDEPIRNGIKKGERVDIYRGWDWERSPEGQIVYNSNGTPKYINQLVNIGHTDPDFIAGLTNNLSYKNFTLSFSFDGRIGGIMYNGLEQKLYEGGMHPATANSFRDDAYDGNATYIGNGVVVTSGDIQYDVQGNIISDTRKFAANTNAVNFIDWVFSTYVNGVDGANIYKRSFVKLREVIIGYNVKKEWLKKTPFTAASVSITGRNLLLFTKVPDMDPDGYSGTTLAEPTYRNIGINLNLKF
ncbi:MAG: SusC/RagA family TonB-linked outer membrane protein [Chitinophagaceae bacterium]|nr:SusC/RagA family TonB-linked outer membrane protein [Chitinophagaceae bacterium]